jgi:fatty acid-binding protein DegV
MSKGIGKLDPFDLTGRRKKRAVKAANEAAQAEIAAKEEADRLATDETKAKEDAALKEEELKKTKSAARQAGISGISDTLAKEGGDAGKRRFLTGAK